MLMCLVDMGRDEMDDCGTEDWVNAIDWGGLWHIDSILGDEDVQFQWCMITTALEEAVSQELLLEISTLFVTVAFASSCVETYKK